MDDKSESELARSEDGIIFATEFDEWQIKDDIPLDVEHLKAICNFWYLRGVARGSAWMSEVSLKISDEVFGEDPFDESS